MLAIYYNPSLKIGIVKWGGNGTAPTAGKYSIALPSDAIPPENFSAVIRNGDNIEVRTDGYVNITLTATYWSGATIAYKIV